MMNKNLGEESFLKSNQGIFLAFFRESQESPETPKDLRKESQNDKTKVK